MQEVSGVYQYLVEIPPKDHAWVIFDPEKTGLEEIKQSILESGYQVKEVQTNYRPF